MPTTYRLLALPALVFALLLSSQTAYAQPIVEPLTPVDDAIEIILTPQSDFPTSDEVTPVDDRFVDVDSASPAQVDVASDAAYVAPEAWERTYPVYLPGVSLQRSPATLNMGNRASVRDFYRANYLVATPSIGWTGNYANCNAGSTSAAYLEATRRRIAYYRAMAGVPTNIEMYAPYVQQAQAAALMMSANGELSHSPSSSWRCYTSAGAQAAGAADLASAPGTTAIDLYMHDSNGGNAAVGHRRWLLYPQLKRIGTGSTPNNGTTWGANALYVIDSATIFSARPAVRDGYVAWPPRGFVPFTIVPIRWSFAWPDANFDNSSIAMWRDGAALPVKKESVSNGYGENTVAWMPQIGSNTWPKPGADSTLTVQISNVRIDGENRTFTYTVVIFDPG